MRLLAAICLSPSFPGFILFYLDPLGQALLVTASCPAALKPPQYHRLQVLYNIVGNALKFTSMGTVGVLVKPTADMKSVVFTVADTGIGIPEKNFSSIFLPFEQVRHVRCLVKVCCWLVSLLCYRHSSDRYGDAACS